MRKIILILLSGIILSGCAQSMAMLGPGVTLATSGNVSQASFSFVANKAVEDETGMTPIVLVSTKIEEQNSKKKIRKDFKKLVETNFKKTRQKLVLEDQSNMFK